MKKFEICSKLVYSNRNKNMTMSIISSDNSISSEDLICDVYIHHVVKDIYPSDITVNRFLQNLCKSKFGTSKRVDSRYVDQIDVCYETLKEDDEDFNLIIHLYDNLNSLCIDDRYLINLKFFKGYTNKEIGKTLDISSEAVRKRLDKILKKLRDTL
ncbi:MAG: sigma-70 family RNA polymerase sigma factor [Cetobacterium sp.]